MARAREIKDVISEGLDRTGLSQAELARQSGVKRQTVNNWLKGLTAPSRKTAPKVAKALGLPLSSLAGDPMHANVAPIGTKAHSDRRVPLLDWVDAGRGAEVVAAHPVKNGYEFIEIHYAASEAAFALRIRGDSMEPRFCDGDVIVVDPTLQPKSEQFVVAELLPNGTPEGSGDVTFKRYRFRGVAGGSPSFDLEPLNPAYPTVTVNKANPGRIIGTVVEHTEILV